MLEEEGGEKKKSREKRGGRGTVGIKKAAEAKVSVGWTYLWIPNPDLQRPIFHGLKKNGLWPGPTAHDMEELIHYQSAGSFWIKLADTGDEHGPGDTAGKAHDIGIYGASLSPELDGPQGEAESGWLGNQGDNVVRNPSAVERAQLGLV